MQQAYDLPDLFAGFADAVMTAVDADACLVSMVDPDRDVVRDVAASVGHGASLNRVVQEYRLTDFPMSRRVVQSGRSAEISRADPDADPAEKGYLEAMRFGRSLMARVCLDDSTTALVEAFRLDDRSFRAGVEQEISMLGTFAANTYTRLQLTTKLESFYTETLEALVSALEARDPSTEAHAGRIADLAIALAVALQIPTEAKRDMRLGAILHDVGKIGISDTILLKRGPLTAAEEQLMRSHPTIGAQMLSSVDFLAGALPVVRHHHERWDGRGYPDGLAGSDIPIGARIVAVCDAFDAMTSERPYHEPVPALQACDELLRGAGGQFDPTCASTLVDIVKDIGHEQLEERLVRYAV